MIKSNRVCALLLAQLLLCTQAAYPLIQEKGSISRLVSQNFTLAAKKATPAVVSIRATLSQKKLAASSAQEDQQDIFQDEIWRRLFGMPAMPQRQEKKQAPMSQGSGFVVTSDGMILTNNHVIENAEKIVVVFSDGTELPAQIIGRDPSTDIALIKIDAKDIPYLTLADSNELEIGEWVIACGNLLGFQTSITVGVVSAKGRNDLDVVPIEEFIQTDAAINRGNSGGPLLNLDAEVVGMNTAFISNSSAGGYMGVGFAIPSNLIKHIMDELVKNGKVIRGFLGVTLQKIDSDLAQAFNLPKVEGALVTDITKDSAAEKAGVKPGDIILKINSQAINNASSLRTCVSLLHPGDQVTLTIRRHDNEIQLPATIGTHPENEMAAADIQTNLGIVVEELSEEMAQKHGHANEKGVFIKYVDPMSIAFDAGLRPGQLILSVNRTAVTTPDLFYKAVQENTNNKQFLFHVKAGQNYRFISLRFE